MTEATTAGLGAALRERLGDRLRLIARAQALEGHPRGPNGEDRRGAEALLRAALRALGSAEGYALAGRVLAGETVAGGGVAEWTALQELGHAGLASWDLGSGAVQPTALLTELYSLLSAAVQAASE